MQVLYKEISLISCHFRNILSLLSLFYHTTIPYNTGDMTKVTKVTLKIKNSRTRARVAV